MGYSRPQLKLLLLLGAVFLTGLGVREWRAGFPAAAERLERFDHEDPPPLIPPAPRTRTAPRWAAARAETGPPARPFVKTRASDAPAPAPPLADPRPLDI